METTSGRAVYISLEDPGEVVQYRLKLIVEEYRLDSTLIEERLSVFDGSSVDGALVTEAANAGTRSLVPTAAMAEMLYKCRSADLIFIDNASDAFDADENSRRLVRSFIRKLGRAARVNRAGLVLLAHIDKHAARNGSKSNSYSGSTAWHNTTRSRLTLAEKGLGVELVQEKSNLGKKIAPIALRWSDKGILVPSDVCSSGSDAFAADTMAVLFAMRAAAAREANIPTGRTGPNTMQHALSTFSELPGFLHGREGRLRFWRAVDHLCNSGAVVKEEYKDSQRHTRTRFVLGSSLRAPPPPPPAH